MNQREPLYKTNFLIMFGLIFVLNLVAGCCDLSRSVCHVQTFNLPCLDLTVFPHWFDLIGLSLTTRFNSFYLDWVLWINSISFIWRLKYIKFNYILLIPSYYLCPDILPFASTWKVVKDAPNYVPMNVIGLAQTSREIPKDIDVLIFLLVLITPKALRYITVPLWYHIIHLLR